MQIVSLSQESIEALAKEIVKQVRHTEKEKELINREGRLLRNKTQKEFLKFKQSSGLPLDKFDKDALKRLELFESFIENRKDFCKENGIDLMYFLEEF